MRTRPFADLRKKLKAVVPQGPSAGALLEETKRLLNQGWVQGYIAVKGDGEIVTAFHPEACGFCLQGAFFRAAHDLGMLKSNSNTFVTAHSALLDVTAKRLRDGYRNMNALAVYNDVRGRSHSDVIRVVDEAIQVVSR